jgi:hypothetical protein
MNHQTLPFLLGETMDSLSMQGNTVNKEFIGRPFVYPSHKLPANARFAHVRRSGCPLEVVVIKNDSGAILKGSRVGLMDVAEGIDGLGFCSGYANTVNAAHPVLIDEFLGENGVPDDHYFYGILSGPFKVKLPGDYNDMGGNWAAGDWLYSAPSGTGLTDDDAGRAAKAASTVVYQVDAVPTPDEVTVNHLTGAAHILNRIGYSLEAVTAGDPVENTLVLIKASIVY